MRKCSMKQTGLADEQARYEIQISEIGGQDNPQELPVRPIAIAACREKNYRARQ